MKSFTLTDKHIKLLKNSVVYWYDVEYGAAGINGKRPYGNSDVTSDIIEILFGDLPEEARSALSDYAYQLHRETEVALQVVLSTGQFEAGDYECDTYGRKWRKKDV